MTGQNDEDGQGVAVLLREDGVLESDSLTGRLVEAPSPTLVRINHVKEVSREARVCFAEREDDRQVSSRVALLMASPLGRINIGNAFMGLNRAALPVRPFTTVDDAILWLRE